MSELKIYSLGVCDFFAKKVNKSVRDSSIIQTLVEGTIEEVPLINDLFIITSFEMNMLRLIANRVMLKDGKFVRIIFGDAFVVKKDVDGQYASIKDSDINIIESTLRPIIGYTYEKVSYINKDLGIETYEFKK